MYIIHCDENKSLQEQCIENFDDVYLLNVRKIYTNNTYFGVTFTILYEDNIKHIFKCKDRFNGAFSQESFIDDKEYLLKTFKDQLIDGGGEVDTDFESDFILKPIDINLPFNVCFAYNKCNNYAYTQVFFSKDSYLRGLYGTSDFAQYNRWIEREPEKDIIFNREPTKTEILSFIQDSVQKFSNVEHSIDTAYSNIKIETKAQARKKILEREESHDNA